jgi:hypothetical protein
MQQQTQTQTLAQSQMQTQPLPQTLQPPLAQQPTLPPVQPQMQPQMQSQPPLPATPVYPAAYAAQKKKSKTPLIAATALCAVCVLGVGWWLTSTGFFAGRGGGRANSNQANSSQTNSGQTSGSGVGGAGGVGSAGSVGGAQPGAAQTSGWPSSSLPAGGMDASSLDTEGGYSYIDAAGDEVILVPVMEGDGALIEEWLMDFMDADEYYEAVNGPYAVLPFKVTDTAPSRLDGYNLGGAAEAQAVTVTPTFTQTKGWPADQLPQGMPAYPDGEAEVSSFFGAMMIIIRDTSQASAEAYKAALKDAGWSLMDLTPEAFQASKDGWVCVCNIDESDFSMNISQNG